MPPPPRCPVVPPALQVQAAAPQLEATPPASPPPAPPPPASAPAYAHCAAPPPVPAFAASPVAQVITVEHFWNAETQRAMLNYMSHTPYAWAFVFLHEVGPPPTVPCDSPLLPHILSGKVAFRPLPFLQHHGMTQITKQSYQRCPCLWPDPRPRRCVQPGYQ